MFGNDCNRSVLVSRCLSAGGDQLRMCRCLVTRMSSEGAVWGPVCSRKAPPKAEITDSGNGESRKKLVAACRGMIRSAEETRRKGHSRWAEIKDNVVQGTRKGRAFDYTYIQKQNGRNQQK